jgi:hypothetical protein
MKKICLLVLVVCFANSCKSTWSQEDKDAFYEACTEEAIKTGDTPEKAKAYCDCVFGKMEAKYPNEEDALGHIDVLAKDTDLIKCKEEVKN